MFGFPEACVYWDFLPVRFQMPPDAQLQTTYEEFAFACGYYVEYTWSGLDDVQFIIESNLAHLLQFSMACSGFILFALASF